MTYSTREYHDMIVIFGECRERAALAAEQYAIRYPNRRHPNRNTIRDASVRLRETGCVLPNHLNAGRPHTKRTAEFEENVLDAVQDDSSTSTRAIARLFAANHVTVHRVLQEENYHDYHFTSVQQLENRDYESRRRYCRRLLRNYELNQIYLDHILWTDESLFTKMGMFNCHNYHQYAQENPHAKQLKSSQYRWTINVWAGIIGDQLVSINIHN
jgi:hypothetical protein